MQSRRRRRLFPGLLASLSLGLLAMLAACHNANENPAGSTAPPAPVAVETAPIELRPLARTIAVTGTLYGDEEAIISAQVAGRVIEIVADVADRVDPGARLAQIDPTDYRLAVEERASALQEAVARLGLTAPPTEAFDVATVPTVARARAQAANTAAKRDRGRQLFEQDPPLMSEQEYQDLVTAYEVAKGDEAVALLEAQSLLAQVQLRQSELATAKQQLDDASARAPLGPASSGGMPAYAVVERLVSLGEYVSVGTPLYRLVADHPLKYRAAVPERFLADVARDQPITLHPESKHDDVVGRVNRITPAIDPLTRMFTVEAIVDNPQRRLRPGSFMRGTLRTGTQPDVVHVPRAAIHSFAGLDKVFTIVDGKAVEHRVTLLARDGDWLPIEGGLDAAEIVVEGVAKLANGVPVTLGDSAAADGR